MSAYEMLRGQVSRSVDSTRVAQAAVVGGLDMYVICTFTCMYMYMYKCHVAR